MKFNKFVSFLTIIGLLVISPGAALVSAQEPTGTSTTEVAPAEAPAEGATEAPTATATVAATEEVTPTEVATPTEAATPTEVVAPTEVVTPTEVATPTEAATPTEVVAPTEVVTPTEVVPTEVVTATAEPTVTPTVEVTATVEPTVTPTVEPTVEVTPTETITPTEVAPTDESAGKIGAQAYDASQSTTVYAMNMGTGAAEIAIQYYDAAGSAVTSDASCSGVPINGQCVFSGAALSSGFRGSGVIGSDQPVAAVVRIIGTSYNTLADYSGKASGEGDTSVFLPAVHRSGWRTLIGAQNMGSGTANIGITILNASGAAVASATRNNIVAGGSAYFDVWNDAEFAGLGTAFSGSAVVSGGGQPVHVAVMENNTGHGGKYAYEGFTTADGGTTVYFPVLHKNRTSSGAGTGWNSSTFIQNLNSANPVTVQVTWRDEVARGGGVAKQASYTIARSSSLYLTTASEPSNRNKWAGSMVVAITSGTGPIVGVSSEVYQNGGTASKPVVSAYAEYRGVKGSATTTALYSPIAEGHYNGAANTGNYSRSFIQNLSTGSAAVLRVEWINPTSGATVYALNNVSVPAGSSFYAAPNQQPSSSGLWNFSGTFKVTSTNGVPIAGLTYDSFRGSSPGETGYPRDTTGLFNMPGQ